MVIQLARCWVLCSRIWGLGLGPACTPCSPLCRVLPGPAALPAAETGLVYFETSAKANINVVQLFDEVADK